MLVPLTSRCKYSRFIANSVPFWRKIAEWWRFFAVVRSFGARFSVMRCLVFGYAVLGFRLCGAWFYGYAVAVWRLCFRLWREGEMKAAERLCRSADIEV